MRLFLALGLALALGARAQADTVIQWNFNSPFPDAATATGSLEPAIGTGWFSTLGDVTTSFSAGDGRDPSSDNSALSAARFPAATNANQSAGVRFDASTADYEQISVSWSQRNSSTASKYVRLQYTLDGYNFSDSEVLTMAADSVFTNRTVSLASITGVANNPAFGIRFVTEWQRTATGAGAEAFVATTAGSTYSTAGTIRFDLVTISGVLQPGGNHAPTISALPPQTVRLGQITDAIAFTVLDAEDPATDLSLSAESSDNMVVSAAELIFGGSSSGRTLSVKAGSQTGTALITVRVSDRNGKSTATTFSVTVMPENSPPSISTIPPLYLPSGASSAPIKFTIGDEETAATALTVTATSSDPTVLPSENLTVSGTGVDRVITAAPAFGQFGTTLVILTVSDGVNQTSTMFPVAVLPNRSVLLADSFNYGEGAVTTNSGNLWYHRSGTAGDLEIAVGQLHLLSTRTEDVATMLLNGPYSPGTGTVLYASFMLTFPALPEKTSGYFAHFGSGNTLCARLYASTTNATPGYLRLLVSNGSGWPVEFPGTIETHHPYRIVLAYAVDTGTSTLWINPSSESDRKGVAADAITPGKISFFGFRQSTDIGGEYIIDDVRLGLSFAAVTSDKVIAVGTLTYARNGSSLLLNWPSGGGTLQTSFTAQGPFTTIYDAATPPYVVPLSGAPRFFRLINE